MFVSKSSVALAFVASIAAFSKPVEAARGEVSCDTKAGIVAGADIRGFDRAVVKATDLCDCSKKCQARQAWGECDFFSMSKSGDCYMKTTSKNADSADSFTHFRHMDKPIKGDIYGFDIGAQIVNTPEDCIAMCRGRDDCDWVNYKIYNQVVCYMKKANPDPNMHGFGYATRSDKDERCRNVNAGNHVNFDIPGFDIDSLPGRIADDVCHCAELCKNDPNCNFFSFNSEWGKCFLKHTTHPYNLKTWFRYAHSPIDGDITGFNVGHAFTDSINDCHARCKNQSDCLWVNFDPAKKECWLKGGNGNPKTAFGFFNAGEKK
ncbi:hypothetical protein HK102_002753 [Quaeritorhiza haematococci]|nr:hypothetical protein HK102_002753 [Quaeritorhiza haematococci]